MRRPLDGSLAAPYLAIKTLGCPVVKPRSRGERSGAAGINLKNSGRDFRVTLPRFVLPSPGPPQRPVMPMPLPTLSLLDTRVIGVLVEKQHTVPDTYPL